MATNFIGRVPLLLLVMALPLGVQAAEADSAVSKQVTTATAHAGMALGAADLKTVHAHLHHVINCLVGPSGKAFDAGAANPCKGMGEGALVDARGDTATETRLQAALSDAEQGLRAATVDAAHADAQKTLAALQAK